MINYIGYISYVASMGLLLLLFPSSFIRKSYESNDQQQYINGQLNGLLESEIGLRICGLFHIILLLGFVLKVEELKKVCLYIYGGFIVLLTASLFDGQGQEQSEKMERFGFQVGIFSFIAYYNWPENKENKKVKVENTEEKQDEKVQQQKQEIKQETQTKQEKSKNKKNKKE